MYRLAMIVAFLGILGTSQSQDYIFGAHYGLAGGDGTPLAPTYDLYLGKYLSENVLLKVGYYYTTSGTSLLNSYLGYTQEDLEQNGWIGKDNESHDPILEFYKLSSYTLGIQVPINKLSKSQIVIYTGANFNQVKNIEITSGGTSIDFLQFEYVSNVSFSFEIDLMYKYKLSDVVSFDIGAYTFTGIGQIGVRGGAAFRF